MSVHLQREIERLKKKILPISARVESAIQDAVKSLKDRDPGLAKKSLTCRGRGCSVYIAITRCTEKQSKEVG